MIVAAVLVAAGSGARLGADVPKAFVEVAGRPLLVHAADRFGAHPGIRDLVVAAPAELVESAAVLVPGARVVPGGRTRQQSVDRALAVLADDVDTVLVHDVARAFVPAAVIDRVLAALAAGAQAVVPTLPVADTIRACDGAELGAVVDRARLAAVQTPQGFVRTVLVGAHEAARAAATASTDATDDAALVEAYGASVVGVAGAAEAFKVTVPLDLALAEAVAGRA